MLRPRLPPLHSNKPLARSFLARSFLARSPPGCAAPARHPPSRPPRSLTDFYISSYFMQIYISIIRHAELPSPPLPPPPKLRVSGSSLRKKAAPARSSEQAPSFWGCSSPACPCAAWASLRFGFAASRRPASQTAIMWPTTLGQCVTPKQGAMDQPVAATAKRTASQERARAVWNIPSTRTALTARLATTAAPPTPAQPVIVIGTGRS